MKLTTAPVTTFTPPRSLRALAAAPPAQLAAWSANPLLPHDQRGAALRTLEAQDVPAAVAAAHALVLHKETPRPLHLNALGVLGRHANERAVTPLLLTLSEADRKLATAVWTSSGGGF